MKLRDNAELSLKVFKKLCEHDGNLPDAFGDRLSAREQTVRAILDAVDRALASPSPETGTAAGPADARVGTLSVEYGDGRVESTGLYAKDPGTAAVPTCDDPACIFVKPHAPHEPNGIPEPRITRRPSGSLWTTPAQSGAAGIKVDESVTADDVRASLAAVADRAAVFAGPAPEPVLCNLLVLGCRYTHTCDPSQATHSPGARYVPPGQPPSGVRGDE